MQHFWFQVLSWGWTQDVNQASIPYFHSRDSQAETVMGKELLFLSTGLLKFHFNMETGFHQNKGSKRARQKCQCFLRP
jgi:hypothetical protein